MKNFSRIYLYLLTPNHMKLVDLHDCVDFYNVFFVYVCLHDHMLVDFFFVFSLRRLASFATKVRFLKNAGSSTLILSFLQLYISSIQQMSHHTPQQVRDFIDDLDAVLRTAVIEKKLKQVFLDERPRVVSNYITCPFFIYPLFLSRTQ